MRNAYFLLAPLALATLPMSAAAGDHGIRLQLSMQPTQVEYHGTYSSSVSTPPGDADNAGRLSVMYTFLPRPQSGVSFVLNAGLDFSKVEFIGAEEEQEGGRIEAGVSYRINDDVRIEFTAALGLGTSTLTSDDDPEGEDGVYVDRAISVRPMYQSASGISVGGELSYSMNTSFYDWGYGDDEAFTRKGVGAAVSVGYTFR